MIVLDIFGKHNNEHVKNKTNSNNLWKNIRNKNETYFNQITKKKIQIVKKNKMYKTYSDLNKKKLIIIF